jgi:hypothetical protein
MRKEAMPLFIPKTLMQSAQGGAQTKRYRDFVVAYFEGEGAIAVPVAIWQPVASWANARQPSGNRMRDRGMLLQRLDVLVTRRGTTVTSTAGGMIPLARLRNAMKGEGVDLKEWNFPPDDVLDKALDPNFGKDDKIDAGTLTLIDPRTARSSAGYELRLIDEATVEYRHDDVHCVLHGVTSQVDGQPRFAIQNELVMSGGPLKPELRQRMLLNVRAALACLGIGPA